MHTATRFDLKFPFRYAQRGCPRLYSQRGALAALPLKRRRLHSIISHTIANTASAGDLSMSAGNAHLLLSVPSSERSNDGDTASLPAVSAVGNRCYPPEFSCASLSAAACFSPWRTRPCSDARALRSSRSSFMMRLRRYQRSRVFVTPNQCS